MRHPSAIPKKIVNKVVARHSRLQAFETINPNSTALVVIDLDSATVTCGPADQAMISTVNSLAQTVRRTGGVAWVRSSMDKMPKHFAAILGRDLASKYFQGGHDEGPGTILWPELHPEPADICAIKLGAGAFFQANAI